MYLGQIARRKTESFILPSHLKILNRKIMLYSNVLRLFSDNSLITELIPDHDHNIYAHHRLFIVTVIYPGLFNRSAFFSIPYSGVTLIISKCPQDVYIVQ